MFLPLFYAVRNVFKSGCKYFEDQRCSSAWYFTLNDEGLYETGYFDIKSVPNDTNRVQYENAIDACAAFIKHQIESIRTL